MAWTVVFATVLADAALVDRVIQIDACEAPPARFAAPASARRGPRAGAEGRARVVVASASACKREGLKDT